MKQTQLASDEVTYIFGELVSQKDTKRIKQLWGKRINPYFKNLIFNPGFDTALHSTLNIIATIENNQRLNERNILLRQRIEQCIKKGKFTSSSGYYSKSVEDNLLHKLAIDALAILNAGVPYQEQIRVESFNDLRRIYKLPLSNSTMEQVAEQEKKIGSISKPKKIYDLKHQYGKNHNDNGDLTSCFKEYHIKGKLHSHDFVRTGLPYVCKVYQCDPNYFQLYVYDFGNRHWALQNTIHHLVTNHKVTLS